MIRTYLKFAVNGLFERIFISKCENKQKKHDFFPNGHQDKVNVSDNRLFSPISEITVM